MNNTTQEANEKANKLSTSTSRQWGGFKNPRIVTVSRAFGGKDRHSKVCTIKGLRDRRIRLSVPTAIQLYHLQDRLGLSQPSKVIDWLIDVAKDDIDKLPPLQIPPNDFTKFQFSHSLFHDHDQKNTNSPFFSTQNANFMAQDHEHINGDHERTKGKEAIEEDDNKGLNFFPMAQSCYNQGLIPYNSYYNWEYPSSNLSLSQLGSSQMDPSSLPQSSSQFFLYPSVATTPYFAPYVMPTFVEHNDAIKQAKLVDSQNKLLFGLNIDSKVHNSQRNDNH